MTTEVEVAIIGAGPYGLSIAAHLRGAGVSFRIFGSPMNTWKNQMPRGMRLKSEGLASTLYDPAAEFTLERFCQLNGIPYADNGIPVRLETFSAYGSEFQRRMVPELEDTMVAALERSQGGFRLQLENGERALARRVVVAAGISHFQYLPPVLSGLPEEFVTHTSRHPVPAAFKGRDVTVIGGGSSAVDMAALLHEAGAATRVVTRRPIQFHNPPGPAERPLMDRLRAPISLLGPGWRSLMSVKAPLVFHRMPEGFRHEVARRHLGPSVGWFVKEGIVGKVEQNIGFNIRDIKIKQDRVHLHIADAENKSRWIVTDHVMAGTGYKIDLERLRFLSRGLKAEIRTAQKAPVLSTSFESSAPGLYFVGAAAAPCFGPLLRFACGAGFTARHLSRQLAKAAVRRSPVSAARIPASAAGVTGRAGSV